MLLLLYMPLLVLLAIAAIVDLRHRRIPNWLTLAIAVGGVAQSVAWEHSVTSWWQSLLGALVGLLINVPLFLVHIRGGGDVKLFVAVGAWLGPVNIFAVFIVATVVAMFAAVAQAVATRRVGEVAHNVAHLSLDVMRGDEAEKVDEGTRHVPYAVPVLLSVIAMVGLS